MSFEGNLKIMGFLKIHNQKIKVKTIFFSFFIEPIPHKSIIIINSN